MPNVNRTSILKLFLTTAALTMGLGPAALAGSSGPLAATLWDRTTHAGEPLDLSQYTMTFNDDFNTLSITNQGCCATWYSPMRPATGVERIVQPTVSGTYISDGAGGLIIRAQQHSDGYFYSGVMQTVNAVDQGWTQKKGYFEMRAKLPQGAGAWPAFFLHSRASLAPQQTTNVEIDILEWYGGDPRGIHSTVHLWPAKYPQPGDITTHTYNSNYVGYDGPRLDENYHTYGCLITDDLIIMYLDRKELARYPITDYPQFREPVYMILDLAIYDATGAPATLDFNVDYVRAWALNGTAPTPAPTPASTPISTPAPTPRATPTPQPPASQDHVSPQAQIVAPMDGSTVKVGQTVLIKANVTDNVAVQSVAISVGGTSICTKLTAPYECSWTVPAGLGSSVYINLRALDTSANNADTRIQLKITNAPTPVVSPSPTPVATSVGTADHIDPQISIQNPTAVSQYAPGETITLRANVTDNVAVASASFYVNDQLVCTRTSAPFECNYVVPASAPALSHLDVKALDSSHNNAESRVYFKTK